MKKQTLGLLLLASCQVAGGNYALHAQGERATTEFEVVVVLSHPEGELPNDVPTEPITYDPRIRVLAEIRQVVTGISPWPVGSRVAFLVHSPSLLLGGYGFVGKQYSFRFRRASANEWGIRWEVVSLKARTEEHSETGL